MNLQLTLLANCSGENSVITIVSGTETACSMSMGLWIRASLNGESIKKLYKGGRRGRLACL